jgi:hypothetical protein
MLSKTNRRLGVVAVLVPTAFSFCSILRVEKLHGRDCALLGVKGSAVVMQADGTAPPPPPPRKNSTGAILA